jgi:hypothetical protein
LFICLVDALLVVQARRISGKENGPAEHPPAHKQHHKSGTAAAAVDRRRSEPALSKKPRASAAAVAPDTEAKPLSDRLGTNRKRTIDGSQDWQEHEGSPFKKHKSSKSASGTALATDRGATLTFGQRFEPVCCMLATKLDCLERVLTKLVSVRILSSAWQLAVLGRRATTADFSCQ